MEQEGPRPRISELGLVGCGVVAGCAGALLSAWDVLDGLAAFAELEGNSQLQARALSAIGWTIVRGLLCLAVAGLAAELGRWFSRQP